MNLWVKMTRVVFHGLIWFIIGEVKMHKLGQFAGDPIVINRLKP